MMWKLQKEGLLKFLKYEFYHRLAYFYIYLFGKDNISYSQNKEDLIIDILTGHKEKGVYIDIGAHCPDKGNNTKKFYERGWNGINIEPDIRGYKLFKEKRLRDINLNMAIGDGEIDYRGYPGDCKVKKITLTPLRQIFKDYKLDFVDFISIDVEGFENKVIKSNDWNKYKAKVLCIEQSGYDGYLKQFGYKKVLFDGTNTYYVLKNLKYEKDRKL